MVRPGFGESFRLARRSAIFTLLGNIPKLIMMAIIAFLKLAFPHLNFGDGVATITRSRSEAGKRDESIMG
jgi:hypothetical protein